jgi:DNA-binding PadR family transcriptional regulator
MTFGVGAGGTVAGGGLAMGSARRAGVDVRGLGARSRRAHALEHPAMVLKHVTLAILSEEPSHGYAIVAKLEQRIGDLRGISHGQVYRVLTALERAGLIVGRAEQVARRPVRRVYAISDTGRETVKCWLMEPPARAMFFEADFYLRLPFLSALDGTHREEALGRQVRRCRDQLAKLVSQRQAAPPTDAEGVLRRFMLEAAIRHREADLEMLERCRAELASHAPVGAEPGP